MEVHELEWDSAFFGFKIGRIDIPALGFESMDAILWKAKECGFSLVYIMDAHRNELSKELQRKHPYHLVDTKVIYCKENLENNSFISRKAKESDKLDDFIELAYESGKYSRFKLDPLIGLNNFQRLYQAWVKKSLSHEIADDVFVYEECNQVCGFCTVKYLPDKATIGLIGVSGIKQGNGIGRDLIRRVEKESLINDCSKIEVATQLANKGACMFYEKMGMQVIDAMDIYHVWLRNYDSI
jgi:dTDP-4-amino-4,6-dideoxy-D-galactose acyltransferase